MTESALKSLYRRWFARVHAGGPFTCVFCGRTFSAFLPTGSRSRHLRQIGAVGIGRRPNARCPGCGSCDRARLLYLYLQHGTDLFTRPARLLHIAPNEHLARFFRTQAHLDYVCGSIDPEDFREFGAIRIDVTDIPFPDGDFDVVICNHVLQQVTDDRRAMAELFRVLKPGGWAILQAPVATALAVTDEDLGLLSRRQRRRRFGSTCHFRIYGRDYAERLAGAGFRVETRYPAAEIIPNAPIHALNPAEAVYLARK